MLPHGNDGVEIEIIPGYLEWRENQRSLYRSNTYIKGIERKPW